MDQENRYDIIIIGAGIIGMAFAYQLLKIHPTRKILVLDKEKDVGLHASGRNSGVLHAGFYYGEHTLKAKFCVEGNRLMKQFCREHNIKVMENRKVVVAQNNKEMLELIRLYEQGVKNGVDLELIDEKRLKAIDPSIQTFQKALLSPTTATVDPVLICRKLKELLVNVGVRFLFEKKVLNIFQHQVVCKKNQYSYKYLINAAGIYALDLSKKMQLRTDYVVLPFKGGYLKSREQIRVSGMHVYPVPDSRYPFLGTHVTSAVDNTIKIGPTALPAFWYEQYKNFKQFRWQEFLQCSYYILKIIFFNMGKARNLAIRELKDYRKKAMIKKAQLLADIGAADFTRHASGIRAQLFNKVKNEWEMDFVVKYQDDACHILNVVSPGFTCAFSFSKYLVSNVING